MTSIRQQVGQRERHPSVALTLVGVVLGAATFGFTAAGVWYQFCLDQGDPEAAAAFADLAPPPAVILLATLGLIATVGGQAETLLKRGRADQSPREPRTTSRGEPSVPSPVASPVCVSNRPGSALLSAGNGKVA